MEIKINVAEILKDKPQGTKLYSPIFGNLRYEDLVPDLGEFTVVTSDNTSAKHSFRSDSRYNRHGEPLMLLPSKEMRDWYKFAWKKGDVLISDCGFVCIFKEWASDDYTKFNGCYFDGMPNAKTDKYSKLDNNTAYGYIREIERKLGGKLNLETLEIEKQLEFKDGDIAYADYGHKQAVFIVSGKTDLPEGYNSFIALDLRGLTLDMGNRMSFFKEDLCKLRLATGEEKQKLFDALAKEGKAWDAEKKQIVDLKPEVELKPFDKVLCRDDIDEEWHIDLFESTVTINKYNYKCMANIWKYCIPYEGNESLLGTTNNMWRVSYDRR